MKTREDAIEFLMTAYGMERKDADQEFSDRVGYFMRGTLRDAGDRAYAVECAIADIIDGSDESDYDADMLELMYN